MTNQDKKAYLSQYVPALRELERLEQEIQTWRARAEGLSDAGDGPSGGGDGRALENAVGQILALEQRLAERIDATVQLRLDILAAIDGVEELRLRRLLELRYICGMGWVEVAKEMGYEVRHCTRLHGQALNVLECPS